jgi:chitin synthase
VYLTVPKDKEGWSPSALLHNETFLSLALSLMSTYGLYLVSSIMYLEPWHMLTSFVQYLFLLPSYVNILLIYAFCNLHDVSWGTKGDNGAANLGAAKIIQKDGEAVVQIQIPNDKQMADLYDQARKDLTIPEKQVKEKRSEETKRSDADRNYRTNVLLLFFTTNIGLIIIFTSTIFTNWVKAHWVTDSNFNPYLTFIFYSVLALAGLRFIGCIIYLLLHILRQT